MSDAENNDTNWTKHHTEADGTKVTEHHESHSSGDSETSLDVESGTSANTNTDDK